MKPPALYVRPEWGLEWDGPAGAVAEANELLAQIAPRSDTVNWLHCYYEPGERWQPVERLVIAEMAPRVHLAGKNAFFRQMGEQDGDSLFSELEGPNPRLSGHYDQVLQQFVYEGLPPNITQRQWRMWRELGAYGRAIWIVQGNHGGHKKSFSELERKILRFNRRPDQPPFAGELPFARLDPRTLDKLRAMDRLSAWMDRNASDWENRTVEDVDRVKDLAMKEITAKVYDWLDSQIADIAA